MGPIGGDVFDVDQWMDKGKFSRPLSGGERRELLSVARPVRGEQVRNKLSNAQSGHVLLLLPDACIYIYI